MDAEKEEHFRVVREGPATLVEGFGREKDVADAGDAHRAGAGEDSFAVGVEFRPVQVRVAVHTTGRQRQGERVDTLRFLVSHTWSGGVNGVGRRTRPACPAAVASIAKRRRPRKKAIAMADVCA